MKEMRKGGSAGGGNEMRSNGLNQSSAGAPTLAFYLFIFLVFESINQATSQSEYIRIGNRFLPRCLQGQEHARFG